LDRPLEFVGNARNELSAFPENVKLVTGFALRQIQRTKSHPSVKRMKGHLRDVIEIVADDDSGDRTYRTTCTVKFGNVVYVLNAFQKKSASGISTPRRLHDLIERRLDEARKHYKENYAE